MPPLQSSVYECHLPLRHCLLPQTSLSLLPWTKRERDGENIYAVAIHTAMAKEQASEQDFSCSQSQPDKRLLFCRYTVFSFSIGMSTTQTRGKTWLTKDIVEEDMEVVGGKGFESYEAALFTLLLLFFSFSFLFFIF